MKSHKKRVLHISHTDIRTDSRILKELAALSDTGRYELSALGVALDGEPPAVDLSRKYSIKTLNLLFNKTKWRPRALRHLIVLLELFLRGIVHCIRAKPQIVHCHDTLVLPMGFVVTLLTGAKLVYDAHELESNKNGQTALLSKGTLLVEKMCWRSIDLLVSVSPSILQWYQQTLGAKANVLVLNAPEMVGEQSVDLELPKTYFHSKFEIPESDKVFLYLGILGQGRGIEIILEAFEGQELGAHVVFMGYGDLAARIENSKAPNIHLHPAVKHNEVVAYARAADVGLCLIENISLSDYYCLPNKFFEYAFAGVPILASKFPELAKYVRRHSLGVCCDLKPESLRDGVKQIVLSGMKAEFVNLTDISWEAQADRLALSYERLST